jgi:hypothetical protein
LGESRGPIDIVWKGGIIRFGDEFIVLSVYVDDVVIQRINVDCPGIVTTPRPGKPMLMVCYMYASGKAQKDYKGEYAEYCHYFRPFLVCLYSPPGA